MNDYKKASAQLLRFAEMQEKAGLNTQTADTAGQGSSDDGAFGATIKKSDAYMVPANQQVSGFLDHLIIDNSLPVYVSSVDGMLLHVNEKYQELASILGDVSLSPGPVQIMNKMPAPTMQSVVQDVLASGTTVKAEENLTIHGKRYVFQGRHMPVCNARGDIIAVAGTYEDITNLTKTVEEAKQTHARFQDFARASSDWMWELNEDLKVKSLSNRFTAVVGQPAMMFIGSKLEQFGGFEENLQGKNDGLEAMKKRKPFRDQLFIIEDYNGTVQKFHLSGVPVFNRQNGEFMGYRGVGNDVSERYAQAQKAQEASMQLQDALADLTRNNIALDVAKQEAQAALKTKNEFLAAMSHELRTPLNAVIGFAESFIGQKFGDLNADYLNYAGDIHSAGKHLLSLINDILDVTQMESGTLKLQQSAVPVNDLITKVMHYVQIEAQDKEIILQASDFNQDLFAFADERRVTQILINLLNNAVKFTPEKGKVGVEVEMAQCQHIAISVWDTGIGIASEHLEKIFGKFEQVTEDFYARKQNGSGLGLHISKGLAEAMGGRLTVSSQEGQGSKFTLYLPLADDTIEDDIDFI